MTAVDSAGQALPSIETPDSEKLRVLGDLLFLAWRSPRHRSMSVALLRTYLEPAVELGQCRIFRFDDVPRCAFTWAHLSADAERRLLEGTPLTPQDWQSGDRLWIVDLIAPYKGITASLVRWIMVPGNLTDQSFHFRRVSQENTTRRIVEINFQAPRLSKTYDTESYLAQKF